MCIYNEIAMKYNVLVDSKEIIKDLKSKMRSPRRPVSIRLPESLLSEVEKLCRTETLRFTDIVEKLLEEFVKGYRPRK